MAKDARKALQIVDASLESLGEFAASIQTHRSATVETFETLRDTCPPVQEIRRQVDTGGVVTTMLMEQVDQRWTGMNLNDASAERQQCRLKSAGGSIVTSTSSAKPPEGSRHSYILQTSSAIRLQVAADLATKEVGLKALKDRERKQAEIAELQRGITLLDKENDVAAALAKLRVYDAGTQDRCLEDFESVFGEVSLDNKDISMQFKGPRRDDAKRDIRNTELSAPAPCGDNSDALVLVESLLMNRLPAAEPSVFSGDIISYMEGFIHGSDR